MVDCGTRARHLQHGWLQLHHVYAFDGGNGRQPAGRAARAQADDECPRRVRVNAASAARRGRARNPGASSIAATPNATSKPTTAHQAPVAESTGKSPNPPAKEPRIAPTVFQAYVSPTSRPTFSRPRPSSAI